MSHRLVKGFLQLLAFGAMLVSTALSSATTESRPDSATVAQPLFVPGLEEPLVATAATSMAENQALRLAVEAYRAAPPEDDFVDRALPFTDFLADHPASAWRMSLLTNLGLGYYRGGYFSRAFAAWRDAWQAGQHVSSPQGQALAQRAVGELARMHARVGHADELESLFKELGDRPISGPATEMMTGAREGLWMFRNEPGRAFLCGPMALKNLMAAIGSPKETMEPLYDERSGPNGYSLDQVARLAEQLGVKHRLVFRAPGQPVPVPSVVNWKISHFAAIVEARNGRYRIQDPTFASGDQWVSARAIDEESSGYYLVPSNAQQSSHWRATSLDEASHVRGMGYTTQNQPGATTPSDTTAHGCGNRGMCVADAKLMVVGLHLNDTPVGYSPQVGPPVLVRLTYNQREAGQPAVFTWGNVGPKWTHSMSSWITDNPAAPGNAVTRYVAGGGYIDYTSGYSFNSSTGAFSPERQGQAVLVRVPASGAATSYELRMKDGSKQVFSRADGSATYPRRLFLTQVVDAAGNGLSLNYDAQLRLTSVVDATSRTTSFAYANTTYPLLVTRITDPFGRYASVGYDTQGRLASITDVLGLVSSFTYDANSLVNSMTTPYGTSQFVYGDGGNNSRFLEITDPVGLTERFEFRHFAPIADSDTVVPSSSFPLINQYLTYRNTFYWDKHAYPERADYNKARITHWLHNRLDQTSPIVESTKLPLERRVWRLYPGTDNSVYESTTSMQDQPVFVGRVLDDGTTQAQQYTYNAFGKPLSMIDAVGRRTVFTYDATGINLLTAQRQTTATGALSTLSSFTYNSQYLPLTYTDASGQTTQFQYNAAGQTTSVTNALLQTTRYAYDSLGRLTTITDANGTIRKTLTYDAFDRVATSTDSEGYVLSYTYDALDRVTFLIYPDTSREYFSYRNLDLVAFKNRSKPLEAFGYDANRRLTRYMDGFERSTAFSYYNNGVLASLTDANGRRTSWDIDIQGRPTVRRYADGTTESYTYESFASRLKSVTDARNQTKTYGYTADDLIKSLTYAGAVNPTPNVSFAYDPFFARRVSMSDGNGTTLWTYVPVGTLGALKLASEDGPYGNDVVGYMYDALGRIKQRAVDSANESFGYDTIGRLTSHSSALGAFNMTYLGATRQVTGQSTGVVSTQWAYESNAADRRLRSVINSGTARSFDLTSSSVGLFGSATEKIGSTVQRTINYAYVEQRHLYSVTPSVGAASNYRYDAMGNLTSIEGTVLSNNVLNQITSFGTRAYSYDANGNLASDGVQTYAWDAENRLVGVSRSGASHTMRYDGLGRRLAIVQSGVETRYLWCGESICQARGANDAVTKRYFPQGQFNVSGAQKLYAAVDQVGTVRDVLNPSTGARLASFDFDAYGKPTSTSGAADFDFRYAGLLYFEPAAVHLATHRAYDPASAHWLSRDPIRERGGINLYAYVDGNPVGNTDPTGLDPWYREPQVGPYLGPDRTDRGRDSRDRDQRPPPLPTPSLPLFPPNAVERCTQDCVRRDLPICMTTAFAACTGLCTIGTIGVGSLACGIGCACVGGAICTMTEESCYARCQRTGGQMPPLL